VTKRTDNSYRPAADAHFHQGITEVMNPLQRHAAGATVVHSGPFSALEVPVDTTILANELREKWVRPLYFGINKALAQDFIVANSHLISSELISQLLANFDWRPRSVAAYLVAVSKKAEFTTTIGRLLLRSDVCFAGAAYCVALGRCCINPAAARADVYVQQLVPQGC